MDPSLYLLPLFIIVGCLVGTSNEKRHYRSIIQREAESAHIAIHNINCGTNYPDATNCKLVMGNAVISTDYFKKILAFLRNLLGGNVPTYESLIDRARREAILRMVAQAPGANCVTQVRVETFSIGGGNANAKNAIGGVEAHAYGTAIWT